MPKNSPFFIDLGQDLSMMVDLLTIPFWNSAGRPKKAKRGTFGFNSQTKELEYWDGNIWFAASMS